MLLADHCSVLRHTSAWIGLCALSALARGRAFLAATTGAATIASYAHWGAYIPVCDGGIRRWVDVACSLLAFTTNYAHPLQTQPVVTTTYAVAGISCFVVSCASPVPSTLGALSHCSFRYFLFVPVFARWWGWEALPCLSWLYWMHVMSLLSIHAPKATLVKVRLGIE